MKTGAVGTILEFLDDRLARMRRTPNVIIGRIISYVCRVVQDISAACCLRVASVDLEGAIFFRSMIGAVSVLKKSRGRLRCALSVVNRDEFIQ